MKKTISVLLASFIILGGAGIAHAESDSSKSERGELTSAVRACVASAVAVREAALASGIAAKHTAVASAYSTRAAALATVWSGTATRAEIKQEIKTIWKDFKSSVKSAQNEWKTDKKQAWDAFKSSVKGCKAPSDAVDTANAGSEE